MLQLNHIHHIAIICKDYAISMKFYTEILGFTVVQEIYRKERDSYKADLSLNGQYVIELFSFPDPPSRPTRPEATGLRHIAFEVNDMDATVAELNKHRVAIEPVRIDEFTGKKFTFIADPDDLPIEFYEK
ncbi:VOC family protein [Ferruginibacter profundus]